MPPSGDVAVVIPARNESDRIQATVAGAAGLPGVDLLIVVDDGSADDTAKLAGDAGATVVRHSRGRGKAAAMETGAEAVRLVEATAAPGAVGHARHLLFLDADLGASAADAGPLTLARQGVGLLQGMQVETRTDPRGIPYHWIGFRRGPREQGPESDIDALNAGRIVVTPLRYDRTDEEAYRMLAKALPRG